MGVTPLKRFPKLPDFGQKGSKNQLIDSLDDKVRQIESFAGHPKVKDLPTIVPTLTRTLSGAPTRYYLFIPVARGLYPLVRISS
jgi:hypothetical protein